MGGAQPPIGVQRHAVDLIQPARVFPAQTGEVEHPQAGKHDLSAVGMAGELEVEEATCGGLIGDIGFVGEEDRGAAPVGVDGEGGGEVFEVVHTVVAVIYPREGQGGLPPVNGSGFIFQFDDVEFLQGGTDFVLFPGVIIVVAKHSKNAIPRAELLERGRHFLDEDFDFVGDKIAGDGDEVGGLCVDEVHDVSEAFPIHPRPHVKIGNMDDFVPVKFRGQPG